MLFRSLYSGDLLLGLEFISDMDLGASFQQTLLEIVRVAQNGQSHIISTDAVLHLRGIVERDGINPLLGFTIDCTTHAKLTRQMISGFFLKWCSKADILFTQPTKVYADKIQVEDLREMSNMMEHQEVESTGTVAGPSLAELFANSDTLVE